MEHAVLKLALLVLNTETSQESIRVILDLVLGGLFVNLIISGQLVYRGVKILVLLIHL